VGFRTDCEHHKKSNMVKDVIGVRHTGKEFLIGTVLYKTKSLDDTKPNTNTKTNTIQLFHAFFRALSDDLQTS